MLPFFLLHVLFLFLFYFGESVNPPAKPYNSPAFCALLLVRLLSQGLVPSGFSQVFRLPPIDF